MKKLLLAGIVLSLSLFLFGCGGNASTDEQGPSGTNESTSFVDETASGDPSEGVRETSNPMDIEIFDYGFTSVGEGKIQFGIHYLNPNLGYMTDNHTLTVVGEDANGNELFTNTYNFRFPLIGGEYFFASDAGSADNTVEPTSVGFSFTAENWQPFDEPLYDYFTITNTSDSASGDETLFEGNITKNGTWNGFDKAQIMVILRDADGSILAGYSGITEDFKEGETVSFSVTKRDQIAFASYEIHAAPSK